MFENHETRDDGLEEFQISGHFVRSVVAHQWVTFGRKGLVEKHVVVGLQEVGRVLVMRHPALFHLGTVSLASNGMYGGGTPPVGKETGNLDRDLGQKDVGAVTKVQERRVMRFSDG